MFYSGQQPFARYITLASGERLLGPTEAVHDLRFFWDWWQERHDSDIRPRLPVGELAREISDRSLRDLRQRETNCDIPISDVIAAHSHDRRLFFTFNHPTRFLIRALCDRILSHIGLPVQPENRPENDEPLGRYVVPSTGFPMTAEQDRYVGNPVVFNTPNLIATTSERKTYTWSELRAAFFQCYDHMAPRIDPGSIRLTPNMPGDLCRDGANG